MMVSSGILRCMLIVTQGVQGFWIKGYRNLTSVGTTSHSYEEHD